MISFAFLASSVELLALTCYRMNNLLNTSILKHFQNIVLIELNSIFRDVELLHPPYP